MGLNFQVQEQVGPAKRRQEWQNQVRNQGTASTPNWLALFLSVCFICKITHMTVPVQSQNICQLIIWQYSASPPCMAIFELVCAHWILEFY